MPNSKHFQTKEEYLNWYRDYRNKNREKIRTYNREYMRKRRSLSTGKLLTTNNK